MNPGKLNHRIKFYQLSSTKNQYGGSTPVLTPIVTSETTPTDVTWGSLEPIKEYHQLKREFDMETLATARILVIRYRKSFTPEKAMIFEDLNYPGQLYTVHSIIPYYPGTKSSFQNSQEVVYKDNVFVFILGIRRNEVLAS